MPYEVEFLNSPVGCPRCHWFGTHCDVGEAAKCPVCKSGVNPLKQKGLDNLRAHYRHLLKIGYKTECTLEHRSAERQRLELFFENIGEPL
jgi:hypothetical protein